MKTFHGKQVILSWKRLQYLKMMMTGLRDYNSLLSKIDSQLKNISEQNQQFELKKKQMENSDDEIEKLLMD